MDNPETLKILGSQDTGEIWVYKTSLITNWAIIYMCAMGIEFASVFAIF
jgi:hypothetical protein